MWRALVRDGDLGAAVSLSVSLTFQQDTQAAGLCIQQFALIPHNI